MNIKVADVMTRRIVLSQPESNIHDVAIIMKDKRISSIVIQEKNRIVGILTERDLVEKVLAAELDMHKTKVAEVMSKPVLTISSDAELEEAARKMRDKKVKKLVAVKNGRAEGIITSFDIIVAEPVIRLIAEKKV